MSPSSSAALLLVVVIAGAGTMTIELSAVRLLAPWFGASSGVWTNVIGVILLALALGYRVGGRLSRGESPRRLLGWALLLSAAFTVGLPYFARPVAEFFLPRGLALDQAASSLTWGSLAASLILFLPAAFALGLIGPLAVEERQRTRGGHAGDAGGSVLAASTLGSLVGTFGTTHLFLPTLGLRLTYLAASGLLALLGGLVLLSTRARIPAVVLSLVWIGGALLVRYQGPSAPEGTRVLAWRESPYQQLRVLESEVDGSPWRRLAVNEGLDSFQSVWQPEAGLLPQGYYYNLFALPAWLQGRAGRWRVLVLGFGAGTAVRVMDGCLPADVTLETVGIEIDPDVLDLAEAWFDVERDSTRAVYAGLDARAGMNALGQRFDQIVLDTYANNVEIPAHLSTVEFFRELRAHLAPGGWLSVNAAGFGLDDPVVRAVAEGVASAFETPVLALRVPFSRNCVLLVREAGEVPEPGHEAWQLDHEGLRELSAAVAVPGAWTWIAPVPAPASDDRNPIERQQRESLRAGRGRWWENP